jgi:hypothetical protein
LGCYEVSPSRPKRLRFNLEGDLPDAVYRPICPSRDSNPLLRKHLGNTQRHVSRSVPIFAHPTHNAGDKASALETIGAKQIDTGRSLDMSKAGKFSPTLPADIVVGSTAKPAFPTHGVDLPSSAKEPTMPPPAKEVDLPERNIERSR